MTNKMRSLTATVAVVLAASGAAAALALPAERAEGGPDKTAVVIANGDAAAITAARESGADVRVVRALAEQLGVTHMLAAQGYDVVVTVGVDRRIAIAPVE